jgi:polyisoprenoid-binding protein YceI
MSAEQTSQLTGTWTVDPDHSRIGFSSRHAMVTKVRGAFNDVSGTIVFDEDDQDRSHVEVTVQMASIDTRSSSRDEHLRSADFFDVETYPEMTFRSTRVEEVDEGGYIVAGDLTIRDITRSMSIPLHFVGVDTDPFGNLRAGFEGTRRIDRREWGVTWNTPLDSGGLLVSDRITLEFEMSLIKQSDEVSPAA